MTKATNLLNISHLDIETLWIVNINFISKFTIYKEIAHFVKFKIVSQTSIKPIYIFIFLIDNVESI